MVEVRAMRLPWPVFASCCAAFGSSPQWRRNRERLARHKLDHRLGGCSEQQVYEHYVDTVKPRATRNDVGKQRKRTRASAEQEQLRDSAAGLDATVDAPDTQRAWRAHSVPPLDKSSKLDTSSHATAPCCSSCSSSISSVLLELQRLQRALDSATASAFERQYQQEERNKLIDLQLAALQRAMQLPSSDSVSSQSLLSGESVSTAAAAPVHSSVGGHHSARVLPPGVASHVPASVLSLLRTGEFDHEAQPTPSGVNNVLWAYTMTEPAGTRACEAKLSVREHMRRESCLIGLRWDDALLRDFEQLVRAEPQKGREGGSDAAVDGQRFVQWKARVAHSAVCVFHEDGRHEMHNPLYLNDLSRVLYRSRAGEYVALLPAATSGTADTAHIRSAVRRHLARLFHVDEEQQQRQQQGEATLFMEDGDEATATVDS